MSDKKVMKWLMVFLCPAVWALDCDKLTLQAQIISFERERGEIVKHDRFVPIEDSLSEHMGDFRNIRIPKQAGFKSVSIAGDSFELVPKQEYLQTTKLHLTRLLIQKKISQVKLVFQGLDTCTKSYQGVRGD